MMRSISFFYFIFHRHRSLEHTFFLVALSYIIYNIVDFIKNFSFIIMVDQYYIVLVLQDIFFALILLFAFIHSCLILFHRRFRHRNNIFILNICFSIMGTSLYLFVFFTMQYFDAKRLLAASTCDLVFYVYNIASTTTPYSFVNFTIYRFCTIVYHLKPFFKTKRWVIICITIQYIIELIVAIPYMFKQQTVSITSTKA